MEGGEAGEQGGVCRGLLKFYIGGGCAHIQRAAGCAHIQREFLQVPENSVRQVNEVGLHKIQGDRNVACLFSGNPLVVCRPSSYKGFDIRPEWCPRKKNTAWAFKLMAGGVHPSLVANAKFPF